MRSDGGYLAEAQEGADNSGAQLQRGDQADRESIHTQDERLSELDNNYSLIMEKEEFKLAYIESSLRRMNVDKTSTGNYAKDMSEDSFRAKQFSLYSETREKSTSRHKTGVRSKDGDLEHGSDRGSLAKHSNVSATHSLKSVFSKPPHSQVEDEERQYTDNKIDYTDDYERALRIRIARILSDDIMLEEERKKRELAEEELHYRLANLRVTQAKIKEQEQTVRRIRIEAMKKEEERLQGQLLEKIQRDRGREIRMADMHRQSLVLEEKVKREITNLQPSIKYDPHINIKPEEEDQRNELQTKVRSGKKNTDRRRTDSYVQT